MMKDWYDVWFDDVGGRASAESVLAVDHGEAARHFAGDWTERHSEEFEARICAALRDNDNVQTFDVETRLVAKVRLKPLRANDLSREGST